jgi:D-serine deaminase-like pyridoxal phosphate-dependent protein
MGDEHSAIFHPSLLPLLRAGPGGDALSTAAALAAIDSDPAIPWPDDAPFVGDIVWLQPGHCDPTVNLYDALYVVAADGTAERWPIDARRQSP